MNQSGEPPPPQPPRGSGIGAEPSSPDGGSVRWGLLAAVVAGVLILAGAIWTQTDLDDDGLAAWTELEEGTTPWRPDTDNDDLADGFEVDRDIDPTRFDTDEDGLNDRRELTEGTNPRSTDSDADGLDDPTELARSMDPTSSDTDADEVADPDEERVGTNPREWDTDGDGLGDGVELTRGANPWVADTDEDGMSDLAEAQEGEADCDGDGIDRIADADDDADHLVDTEEDEAWRCNPDTDADDVLDGLEAARVCVEAPDCDADGLQDARELGTAYDRLDPDTFDVGILDGVTRIFQDAGQPPSPDRDEDGIPDAWERSTGLIDWEHFDPEPGRRDLLVEFVRVEGPDSGPLGPGPMTGSYESVADFFALEGDVQLTWIETTVDWPREPRPPLIPSAKDSYYRDVLQQARTSSNPYVTTVVMNPQHDQSQTTHQGVAPIRGMLAAVDYGAHTRIRFEAPDGSSLRLTPLIESLIVANRTDLIGGGSVTGGGQTADGQMFLSTENSRLTWTPFWFRAPVEQTFDDGRTGEYQRREVILDPDELADTIAHELGHTLGLCHLTLEDCQANLSAADQGVSGVSTMDPRRTGPELEFLDSEWVNLREYLTCPPQRPITLISEGANRDAVIDAKYEITLENLLDVNTRECQDYDPVPGDLHPARDPATYVAPYTFAESDLAGEPTTYEAPDEDSVPQRPEGGTGASWGYAAASLAAAAIGAGAVVRWPG